MRDYREHFIKVGASIREALSRLDHLASDAVIFVVDTNQKLIGSLTDGDIRRGLLTGTSIDHNVESVIYKNPRFVCKGALSIEDVVRYRKSGLKVIPVVDAAHRIVNVINFNLARSYLPVDAVIMAGGKGQRLKPLTDKLPKPLLKVGDKPIMRYAIDRLRLFGVDDFWITVNHMGDKIQHYLDNIDLNNLRIRIVKEPKSLGTIGSVRLIEDFVHPYILITNSDILTNLDFEDFFIDFVRQDADLAVLTIPYKVDVPYAVLETSNGHVLNLREKPSYTYFSNGGIYLIKKSFLNLIPLGSFFDATDLLETMIGNKLRVVSYPMNGYWLDIGRMEDYEKAQEDVHHIDF